MGIYLASKQDIRLWGLWIDLTIASVSTSVIGGLIVLWAGWDYEVKMMDRLESESNVGNDSDESAESARYLPAVICSRAPHELDFCPTYVLSACITLTQPILKVLYLRRWSAHPGCSCQYHRARGASAAIFPLPRAQVHVIGDGTYPA